MRSKRKFQPDGDGEPSCSVSLLLIMMAVMMLMSPSSSSAVQLATLHEGAGGRSHLIKRQRGSVAGMHAQLGDYYFRRSYRMNFRLFTQLVTLLDPPIRLGRKRTGPNGKITTNIRVSACLRYLAGGDTVDIALTHGISHSSVFASVWYVVDAVNRCKTLDFKFPVDHVRQKEIARGFQLKSDVSFY